MAEEEKKEGEGEAAAAPKSKKKLIIIGAVVGLIVIGGGAALFLTGGEEKKEGEIALDEHSSAEKETVYEHAELDTFIVNLSENSSFLKVRLLLEYDPEILAKYDHPAGAPGEASGGGHGAGGEGGESGGLPPILKKREPMIRDAIIRVLSAKTADDVLSIDGKERLKEELVEAVNEAVGLDESPIVGIYFLEFIIQ